MSASAVRVMASPERVDQIRDLLHDAGLDVLVVQFKPGRPARRFCPYCGKAQAA